MLYPLVLRTLKVSFSIFQRARTAGRKFGDIVRPDRQVGDETVAVGDLAIAIDDLDFKPVDLKGILAAAQGDVVEPAVAENVMGLALLDPVLTGRKLNPRKIFCNQRMRGRLADENEMGTGSQHRLAQRLTGKQIIAEIDRIEPCIACRM